MEKAGRVERMESLETSLQRAELKVTVLQSQCAANQKDLDELGEQLQHTQELAHPLATRLLDMEQREEGVWAILKELREDVFELKQSDTACAHDRVGENNPSIH